MTSSDPARAEKILPPRAFAVSISGLPLGEMAEAIEARDAAGREEEREAIHLHAITADSAAVAEEREACARIAVDFAKKGGAWTSHSIATRIRARAT